MASLKQTPADDPVEQGHPPKYPPVALIQAVIERAAIFHRFHSCTSVYQNICFFL
jgi:hypothetical protein